MKLTNLNEIQGGSLFSSPSVENESIAKKRKSDAEHFCDAKKGKFDLSLETRPKYYSDETTAKVSVQIDVNLNIGEYSIKSKNEVDSNSSKLMNEVDSSEVNGKQSELENSKVHDQCVFSSLRKLDNSPKIQNFNENPMGM